MSRYLDIARRRREANDLTTYDLNDLTPAQVVDITALPTADAEGRELLAAGWQLKERLGKTIWRDPRDGLWLSQEMALRLSEQRGVSA